MTSPDQFNGWLAQDKDAVNGKLRWESFTPKPWAETDIDIKISHCGICGSDIHTLRSGWGYTHYPACVGHEIVGHVTRVGSEASARFQVGDRVGVGAQSSSCRQKECKQCAGGHENLCQNDFMGTYNSKYSDSGYWSKGGYADYSRVPAHFAVKIPDGLSSEVAAPMLCGGVTMWTPLTENGAGPGKAVGIVGVGGLGHFGILFARALGCEKVVAISRSRSKAEDAKALGATEFIATGEDHDWAKKHAGSLDLIISTVSSPDMPLSDYLTMLNVRGSFIQVGAPEDVLPPISAWSLLLKACKIGGSAIGSPAQIEEMLEFAAKKSVKPWIQQRPMRDANQSVVDMADGKARFRYVLVNEDQAKL